MTDNTDALPPLPTEDQCDQLVAKVMDKIAAQASDQYGTVHALDLNPSITEHHTLRRGLVQVAYMLGAMEARAALAAQQGARVPQCVECGGPVQWRCPACGIASSKAASDTLSASPQAPAQQGAQVPPITDAMVAAYLTANDAYWREVDALPSDPTKPWRQGTPKEATRVSLEAALSASPQAPAQPEQKDMGSDVAEALGGNRSHLYARDAAPAAQAEQEPVAWMHPDGRVVPHSTIVQAHMDGGAMLSSLSGYTIPLVRGITKEQP